jgi:1-deoxy-D-xylulose-5-phosphate synthase
MTGGMAYEALNNLGHSKSRVIIVLNDNGRSYAPTISNLTSVGVAPH